MGQPENKNNGICNIKMTKTQPNTWREIMRKLI